MKKFTDLFGGRFLKLNELYKHLFADEAPSGLHNAAKDVDILRDCYYLMELAANAGLIDAQRDLGYSYFYGEGVKVDKKKAVLWYKKAAGKNDDKAFYNLGLCYKFGDGVKKSRRWTKYYFLKADKFGHKLAKGQLRKLGKE